MTPVIIWLNSQQETMKPPLERFNDIMVSLVTVSMLLDSIFK
jgi:hypothetical protein